MQQYIPKSMQQYILKSQKVCNNIFQSMQQYFIKSKVQWYIKFGSTIN